MEIPIDCSRMPFRSKYLLETPVLAPWFIFGEKADSVDLSSTDGDVFQNVPKPVAEQLLAARHKFLEEVQHLLTNR